MAFEEEKKDYRDEDEAQKESLSREERDDDMGEDKKDRLNERLEELRAEIDQKKELLQEKEEEKDQLLARLQRAKADFTNYKKRVEKARFHDKIRAQEEFILELLPVLDNFERALDVEYQSKETANFARGVDMIFKQLWRFLEEKGLQVIEATGEYFDPEYHEAVESVYFDNYPEDTIVEVVKKGYKIGERVLRPAMVKVNKGGEEDEQNSGD